MEKIHARSLWKLPFHPNKSKAEQTEKSTILFGSVRQERTQGKSLPLRLANHTGKSGSCSLTDQRLLSRNCQRHQCQSRKISTVMDELPEAECRQVRALKITEGPRQREGLQYCEIYLKELEVPTVNI